MVLGQEWHTKGQVSPYSRKYRNIKIYHMVFIFLCRLAHKSLEVVSSIAVPLGLGQLDEDASGPLPLPVPADGAVAEVTAWRTGPGGVHQGLTSIFSIPGRENELILKFLNLKAGTYLRVRHLPQNCPLTPTHSPLLQTVFMSVVFCLNWGQEVLMAWL